MNAPQPECDASARQEEVVGKPNPAKVPWVGANGAGPGSAGVNLHLVPLGVLAAATAVLLWRRLADGFHHPLPWPAGLCVGLVLCGLTVSIRGLDRAGWGGLPTPRKWLVRGVGTGLAVLAGASITLAGTSPLGVLALWAPLVIGEAWGWSRCGQPVQANWGTWPAHRELTHRIVRFRTSGGEEAIEGTVRCSFSPRQRSASAHVAFCPPFAGPPRVTARLISGPKARVRVGLVLIHGVRFDIRLADSPVSPQEVEVQFSAFG